MDREIHKVYHGATQLNCETRADGTLLLWHDTPLPDYPRCLSDRILHWAKYRPDQTWMAERDASGAWHKVNYRQLGELVFKVGSALLELGLSVERPLIILSSNSLEHAIIALSAQHVGIASAAIAPAYSLLDDSFEKLNSVAEQITPGAVFTYDAAAFSKAITHVFEQDLPVISVTGAVAGRTMIHWDTLKEHSASGEAQLAFENVTGDTVAKFMFTSGTTGHPKAVTTTQQMMCANMEQYIHFQPHLKERAPVIVDWGPWNHVSSGNLLFNTAIYNGGSYYIDAGKPTTEGISTTIKNLKEISPSSYVGMPIALEMICAELEKDPAFAETFFKHLNTIIYAGAGLPKSTWDKLLELSTEVTGKPVTLTTGLGSTETTPAATFCAEAQDAPGNIGMNTLGLTMKLVPMDDKYEVRFKGVNITPGYWRAPQLTQAAFDEEGFYCMGDALTPADPNDPGKGFFFAGRIAENFKLHSGVWIAVGNLRETLVTAMDGLIRDAVIIGENRSKLGALLIPFRPNIEKIVEDGSQLSDTELFTDPAVIAAIQSKLTAHAMTATGSSRRIALAYVLTETLLAERGEVTDKGSINQRAVRANKADLIDALYSGAPNTIHAQLKL